jgi:hypothetical protein
MQMKYLFSATTLPRWSMQFLVAVLLSMIVAYMIGTGLVVPGMVTVAALYMVLFYAGMTQAGQPGRRDSVFWVMMILLLLMTFYKRFIGKTLFGFPVSGFLELWLLAVVPLILPAAGQWIRDSGFARMLMFLVVVFLSITVLSSVFGKSTSLVAVTYQFLSNLKFLFMLAVGFYIAWSPRTEAVFWWLVRWLWLPLTILGLWKWMSPSTYILSVKLFGAPDWAINLSPHFMGFPGKAFEPFVHALYMGYFASLLMLFSLIKGLVQGPRSYLLIALCYLWLLIASGQKGEMGAMVVVVPVIFAAIKGRRYFLHGILATVVFALGLAVWALNSSVRVQTMVRNWAFIGERQEITDISSSYGVMYIHAYQIANEFMPLGSGLGTYGTGAAKFDLSFFLERGFENLWWWGDKNFLTDTLWPTFIAETGWFGAFTVLLILFGFLAYAANESMKPHDASTRVYWLMAFAGLLFTGLNSPTSAAVQNTGLFFFTAIFFGVAYNMSQRRDAQSTEQVETGVSPPGGRRV